MTIQEARLRAETRYGHTLSQSQFEEVLEYVRHKARVTGHEEDYVPMLLEDEIQNYLFQETINNLYKEAQDGEQLFLEMLERREKRCANSASTTPA